VLAIFTFSFLLSLIGIQQQDGKRENRVQCIPRPPDFDVKHNHMENVCGKDVGRKMKGDGSYQRFEGITIISFLLEKDRKLMANVKLYLEKSAIAKYYSFLPEESYHVTIFDVIQDELANREGFGSTQGFIQQQEQQLCSIINNLKAKEDVTFQMKMQYIRNKGLSVYLEPIDSITNATIYDLRDSIRKLLNSTIHKTVDSPLHLTFAYTYIEPTVQQWVDAIKEFEKIDNMINQYTFTIKSPKLTHFLDMTRFDDIDTCEDLALLKETMDHMKQSELLK